MTKKERVLNAITGRAVDRVPWSPLTSYWWEAQSREFRDRGELAMFQEIDADPLVRGYYPTRTADCPWRDLFVVDTKFRNCQVSETVKGREKIKVYETRIGNLVCKYRIDPSSNTWFLTEHPLNTREDYKTLQFIMENAVQTPASDDYEDLVRFYGDEMLIVPRLVPGYKTAFQAMIEHWAGTYGMIDMLDEDEELVEETMAAIQEVNRQSARLCCESSSEVFISFEDSSTTNYSPGLYERYVVPELNEWADILHKENKYLIQHACGHIKALLPIIAKSKIDCLESVTPFTTGNVTMKEVAEALPERISIIGGIDPIMMLSEEWEPLEQYATELLETMKGRSFILSNSDSLPPGVKLEYLKRLGRLVR